MRDLLACNVCSASVVSEGGLAANAPLHTLELVPRVAHLQQLSTLAHAPTSAPTQVPRGRTNDTTAPALVLLTLASMAAGSSGS